MQCLIGETQIVILRERKRPKDLVFRDGIENSTKNEILRLRCAPAQNDMMRVLRLRMTGGEKLRFRISNE